MSEIENKPKKVLPLPAIAFGILLLVIVGIWLFTGKDKELSEEEKIRIENAELRTKWAERDRQDAIDKQKNAEAERDRKERDDEIKGIVGQLSKLQQAIVAQKGLISNGLLPSSRSKDTIAVKLDSQFVAGVAVQGQLLTKTREDVVRQGQVLVQTQNQISDLEILSNKKDESISNLREFVQDKKAEASGIFSGKRRKVLTEVDKKLSETQKIKLKQ